LEKVTIATPVKLLLSLSCIWTFCCVSDHPSVVYLHHSWLFFAYPEEGGSVDLRYIKSNSQHIPYVQFTFSSLSIAREIAENVKASAEILSVTAVQMDAAVVAKNGCYVVMEVWSTFWQIGDTGPRKEWKNEHRLSKSRYDYRRKLLWLKITEWLICFGNFLKPTGYVMRQEV
jgi:hypothetical protein